jgi:cobalt/nickel transport system ATP-binding protein
MEDMDLSGYANRPPHFLSGGEKKRVTIADIVVMNPEVILFDEPTASLDCEHIQIFKEQLDKLHKEHMTLIVSTHDMNFVWEWADRVIVFSDGEVIADDRPEKIFTMEAILDRAALRKPILLEAYEIMVRKNAIDCVWLPRTMKELKQAMISDKGDSTYE